ncbi:nuclear transport factor 2 family protein [Streptomyces sp. NPDC052721]|uniref:ester cyclase n=1 Tax=Streptomyces sp. NPDC052721 TaxID=3154955 RepID=UPI00343963C6
MGFVIARASIEVSLFESELVEPKACAVFAGVGYLAEARCCSSHKLIYAQVLDRKREMTDDVRVLAQRMYQAFNARDLTAATAIFSADFVSHPLGTVGVDSVVKAWSGLHALFPDIQVIVEDMLVEADRAAVRTSLHGIPAEAEGQAFPLPSMMEIFRVQDGRIAELWGLSSLSRPGR